MKNVNYKWIALSCTSMGVFFSVLNSSTILIALPEIGLKLNATSNSMVWTMMIYMLTLTILVPSIGRVADIIGRKKLFIWGFIIFTIGSLLCSFAISGWELVAFRFVQSIGGALIVANSTPIVADAFPKEELGKAMGINGMIISVAAVFGPIIGGVLIYMNIGWQSIFYINIPIGIIGTIWSIIQLKELDVLPQGQKFDWFGTITFTIGLLSLLIALSFGGHYALEMYISSVIFIGLFIFIENKVKYPMLDLRLFKSRLLAFAYSTNLLNGIARGAVTFLLVIYFEEIKGMSAVASGLMLIPFAISMVIMSPISGYLSDRYGGRELSSIGLLISALGLLGLVFIRATTPNYLLAIWMFVSGLGSGMFFSPNTSAIMGAVPTDRKGIAAGVRTMMNNAGSVISMALAMAIFSSVTKNNFQNVFLGVNVGNGISSDQFITGLRIAFIVSFIISIIAAMISYFRGNEKQPTWN